MRIAQVSPLTEAVPPKLYGGTERVISWLTEELVAMGHDVTLFASGDSTTSAKLEAMWPKALRLDGSVRDPNALHMSMIEQVCRRADEFDIIHYAPRLLSVLVDVAAARAVRDDAARTARSARASADVRNVLIRRRWCRYRTPSGGRSTRRTGSALSITACRANLLSPLPVKPSYLAFLGRISPEKRVDRAVRIAQRCGLPLKVAAKVDAVDVTTSMMKSVRCSRMPHVEYIGEITDSQKSEFLSGAIALLVPIDWPEPFGLVMIEAHGLRHAGDRLQQGLGAGDQSRTASPASSSRTRPARSARSTTCRSCRAKACRRRFEQKFTSRRMAEDYLAIYRQAHVPERRTAGLQAAGRRAIGRCSEPSISDGSSPGRVSGITSQTASNPITATTSSARNAV